MSHKQNITRDNHYVPQFYLRYWSNNGNTIHSYNGIVRHVSGRKWQSSSIKSTACLPDYYTDEINGSDDDKVEKIFQRYEDKAKPIFEKVIQDEPLSDTELHTLVDYLIVQTARTPSFCEFSNEIVELSFPPFFEQTIKELEGQAGKITNQSRTHKTLDKNHSLPLALEFNKEEKTVTGSTCTGRHMFLSNALGFLNGKIAELLRNATWRILPSEEPLLTSDNPVVFLRFDKRAGGWVTSLNATASYDLRAVFLPLTPHHLLITCLFESESELDLIEMSEDFCEFIQKGIVLNARRYIYANYEDRRVAKWRPQLVDEKIYDRLESERLSWHESNLELEKDFFPHQSHV